jgi:hypothetical protein
MIDSNYLTNPIDLRQTNISSDEVTRMRNATSIFIRDHENSWTDYYDLGITDDFLNNNITHVLTNEDLEHLGKGCLAQNNVLQKVWIVTRFASLLPNHAFKVYGALTEVYLGDSIMTIGCFAFSGCISLQTVRLPPKLAGILNSAFQKCCSLTNIIVPSTVIVGQLGSWVFASCQKLKFDDANRLFANLTVFHDHSFSNCKSITTFVMPATVTELGAYCFEYCSLLQNISFSRNSQLWKIEQYCFKDCESLIFMQLPGSVAKICQGAFCECSSLKDFSLPDGVKFLPNLCFRKCISLTNFDVRPNIQSIG